MGISEALQAMPLEAGYPLDRILVPLDGSGSAERILSTIRALYDPYASRLILVRIVEAKEAESQESSLREAVRIAEMYLKRTSAGITTSTTWAKTIVRIGPAPETLLAIAAQEGASLVAMSTHGRLTPEALPFGKVAESLLQSSAVPILAVPVHASSRTPEHLFRTLLVPSYGDESASDLAAPAVDFALSFGADLAVLLRIVPTSSTGRAGAERLVEAEEHLRKMARPFESKRIPTFHIVKDQDPVSAILAVAQEHQADVLAISTGAAAGVDEVTRRILQTSTIPVLLGRSRSPVERTPGVYS